MEYKTIKSKVGDENFLFCNEYKSSRSGFSHRSTLVLNGEEVATARAVYYNRTWESYRYQSVMRSCIYRLILNRESENKERVKLAHNAKRWNVKFEGELDVINKEDLKLELYQDILTQIMQATY